MFMHGAEFVEGMRGVVRFLNVFQIDQTCKKKPREGELHVTSSVMTGGFRLCDGLVSGPY